MKSIAAAITSCCLYADGLWLAERSKSMAPALASDHVTSFLQVVRTTIGGVKLNVVVTASDGKNKHTKTAYLHWEFDKIVDVSLEFIKEFLNKAGVTEKEVEEEQFSEQKKGLECGETSFSLKKGELAQAITDAQKQADEKAVKTDGLEKQDHLSEKIPPKIKASDEAGTQPCFPKAPPVDEGQSKPPTVSVTVKSGGDGNKVSLFASVLLEKFLEERVPQDLIVGGEMEGIEVEMPVQGQAQGEKKTLEVAGKEWHTNEDHNACHAARPQEITPLTAGDHKDTINLALASKIFLHLMFPCPDDQSTASQTTESDEAKAAAEQEKVDAAKAEAAKAKQQKIDALKTLLSQECTAENEKIKLDQADIGPLLTAKLTEMGKTADTNDEYSCVEVKKAAEQVVRALEDED